MKSPVLAITPGFRDGNIDSPPAENVRLHTRSVLAACAWQERRHRGNKRRPGPRRKRSHLVNRKIFAQRHQAGLLRARWRSESHQYCPGSPPVSSSKEWEKSALAPNLIPTSAPATKQLSESFLPLAAPSSHDRHVYRPRSAPKPTEWRQAERAAEGICHSSNPHPDVHSVGFLVHHTSQRCTLAQAFRC